MNPMTVMIIAVNADLHVITELCTQYICDKNQHETKHPYLNFNQKALIFKSCGDCVTVTIAT